MRWFGSEQCARTAQRRTATNEWRRYAHAKVGDFCAAIADYTLVRPWQCMP
jgi:hypothetical protein